MLYLTAYVVLYEYDMVGCKDKMFGLGTIINVGVAVFSLGLNKKVNAGKYRVCICG